MPGLVDFEERSRAREIFHARIYAPVFSSLGVYNFKTLETNITHILILLNQSYNNNNNIYPQYLPSIFNAPRNVVLGAQKKKNKIKNNNNELLLPCV